MKPNFWIDNKLKLQPLTDGMVQKAEEKLHVKLLESYINLLKIQNGGYINAN